VGVSVSVGTSAVSATSVGEEELLSRCTSLAELPFSAGTWVGACITGTRHIGQVFEMGHFAIIAAYASAGASSPTHSPYALPAESVPRRRGRRGSLERAGREDEEGEMVLVMDVWTQACDAYWVPVKRAWAAMCTGKGEPWGNGNFSTQSRGFLLVSRP